MEVGLGPGYIVLWGPSSAVRKGHSSPLFRNLWTQAFRVAKRLDGSFGMPVSMKVGLGPGHIMLDEDPAAPKGHSSPRQFSAHVWMDQDATWYGGDIALHADPAPPRKAARHGSPLLFSPYVFWPDGRPSQPYTL